MYPTEEQTTLIHQMFGNRIGKYFVSILCETSSRFLTWIPPSA
ncbi:hypothetical protein ACFCP7_08760 [Paenibacillus elgii]